MRRLTLIPLLASLALAAAAAQEPVESEYRNFTGSNDVVIEAVLLDKTDDHAVLLLRNGQRANVPFDRLSKADQEYIASWSREKAIFLRQCRGLSVRQLLELRGYESFTFELENNSIFIRGKLNGTPARFLIDTGAGVSLLHAPFAEEAGLEVGPMTETIFGVAGEAPAGWVEVPTLELGEAVFKDRQILATDLLKDRPEGTAKREDIILGAEFMAKLDAVISYQERRIFLRPDLSDGAVVAEAEAGDEAQLAFRLFKVRDGRTLRGRVVAKNPTTATLELVGGKTERILITLFEEEDASYIRSWTEAGALFLQHCQSLTIEELLSLREYQSFQYERRGNHIFVEGTLNDEQVSYLIDTGADSSLLDLGAAGRLNCEIGPMDQEVWGIGGKAPAAVTRIQKITMGEAVLTNRRVLATDLTRAGSLGDLGYVGLFGADFMRELDAVITYRDDRIFLIQR
jgi:predicted aspartyl protease